MNKVFNISLIALLTLSLSGQSSIASGLLYKNSNLSTAVSSATHFEETLENENSQIIEDWMIDFTHWEMQTDDGYEFSSVTEIEAWMLDVDRWSLPNNILAEESETIENWMKDPCHWNFSGIDYCESTPEIDYQLLGWMINPYYFQI